MTLNTFMDTFTLFRNSLEKQGTRFREVFPTEKRVAIVFRISHQRYSMKKDLRPAVLLKKRLWHRCFPVNFAKFLRRPFLQNTSGRLFLFVSSFHPANIYLFKVSNRKVTKGCNICPKLTIKRTKKL